MYTTSQTGTNTFGPLINYGVSHRVNVDVKNSGFSDFFEKILSVDLNEVVSVDAIDIIGVKQGKNKEKGKKEKQIGRSAYRGVGFRLARLMVLEMPHP